MNVAQSLWRGKNLIKKLDVDNTKYIVMSGPQSFLNFPITAEQNSVYKICIEMKKESGNGILYCNIYGNKNFDFPQTKIFCENLEWEDCEFYLETKSFPKTLPLIFRLWRGSDSSGSVAVKTIIASIEEEAEHNGVIFSSNSNSVIYKDLIVEPEIELNNLENAEKINDDCFTNNIIELIDDSLELKNIISNNEQIDEVKVTEVKLEETQNKKTRGVTLSLIKDNIFFSQTPQPLEKENNDKIFLFTPYYNEDGYERQDEMHLCLKKNIENKYVHKIVLFSEVENIPEEYVCDKVDVVFLPEWTTYNNVIKYINEKDEFSNSYNIILNSDMYLDESISLIKKMNIDNCCVAISPWSVDKNIIINELSSQGCWIFKNKIKEFDFIIPMGRPGCEHRLLYELHQKGYSLCNLCYDIFVWHKHLCDIRKYSSKDRVSRPYIMLWSDKHNK